MANNPLSDSNRSPLSGSAGIGDDPMSDERFHRGVYVISVAAELAGVHPQTLRIYDRKGLLEPERTSGGSRRYSDADIERVAKIAELTEQGLNLAGVVRVLELEQQVADLESQIGESQIGEAQVEATLPSTPHVPTSSSRSSATNRRK